MTPHGFSEDQLVEQPALEVLEALGWGIVTAADEVFGPGETLGRAMAELLGKIDRSVGLRGGWGHVRGHNEWVSVAGRKAETRFKGGDYNVVIVEGLPPTPAL